MPLTIPLYVNERQKFLALQQHMFFYSEAKNRLLNQFENLEDYAVKMDEEFQYPGDIDSAYKPDFGALLAEMHNRTQLSMIAAMFFEFEKQIRSWIAYSISDVEDCDNKYEDLKKEILRRPFSGILNSLMKIRFSKIPSEMFKKILTYRHVVNVFKHGQGRSMNWLKENNPEFLKEHYEEFETEEDWKSAIGDGVPALKIDNGNVNEAYEVILHFIDGISADKEHRFL